MGHALLKKKEKYDIQSFKTEKITLGSFPRKMIRESVKVFSSNTRFPLKLKARGSRKAVTTLYSRRKI